MRVTVIREDGVVGADELFRQVVLSPLPAGIRAIQWDGASGHVEYDEAANTHLETMWTSNFIDHLSAAEPQPPASPAAAELKKVKMSEK